jgi:hypothetical protein
VELLGRLHLLDVAIFLRAEELLVVLGKLLLEELAVALSLLGLRLNVVFSCDEVVFESVFQFSCIFEVIFEFLE